MCCSHPARERTHPYRLKKIESPPSSPSVVERRDKQLSGASLSTGDRDLMYPKGVTRNADQREWWLADLALVV
jgi:hypothetical protein